MKLKLILNRISGRDAFGYIFADQLSDAQLSALGLSPTMPFGAEMLEVEGDTETLEFWVYNGKFGVQIEIDEQYFDDAMHEYVAFHPLDDEPDSRDFES